MRSIAVAAVCCLCLVSCVGTKEFTIHTQPEGADVTVNGVPQIGRTPLVMTTYQDKDLGIVASKPGYETAAHTVRTRSNWWLALLWTKTDPRAQYIEEDEVTIPLKKIPTAEDYRPSAMPPYTDGGGATTPKERSKSSQSTVPSLRPMPSNLEG